jgi:Cupin domain
MLEVSYPPGARDMVHRHDAHAFVYVLEGQVIMQLKGQPAVTLKAGSYRCSRRGAQRQQHGAGQVRRGAAEGQGGPGPHAGERMMLGTVRPTRHRSAARPDAGRLIEWPRSISLASGLHETSDAVDAKADHRGGQPRYSGGALIPVMKSRRPAGSRLCCPRQLTFALCADGGCRCGGTDAGGWRCSTRDNCAAGRRRCRSLITMT